MWAVPIPLPITNISQVVWMNCVFIKSPSLQMKFPLFIQKPMVPHGTPSVRLITPPAFSASGLPTRLSVNPDTGEISGHTTAIGDHNVTVTASNLSGSDSKVVTLTVNAAKPLLESGLYQPTGGTVVGCSRSFDNFSNLQFSHSMG